MAESLSAVERTEARSLVRALVLFDLVDSTRLVERLGDSRAAQLMRQHDRMARDVMRDHEGTELDRTDGFLTMFERPAQAVRFALEYKRRLRTLAEGLGQPLQARAGIHFGDIVVWENAPEDVQRGARPSEVDGLAISVVARVTALALPDQILVTDVAEAVARRARKEFEPDVRWLLHGRYALKGLPDAIAIFEVGEVEASPLRAPPRSDKAWPSALGRRWTLLTGGGLALASALGGLSLSIRSRDSTPPLLKDRDWVVVGDILNVNADATLNAGLGAALRIGISESRFVNVLPDNAVRQALARMKRDVNTPIDRDVGIEIALREQARAVILPSLVQSGSRLRLALEVVDPGDGRAVWTQSVDAEQPNDLLPAIDRLLRRVRHDLGESLQQIRASSHPLEQVTTPNLEALRTLSKAYDMERDGRLDQAERMLRHAIELDPGFATAYRGLAAVLYEQERYRDCQEALRKALSIEGRLTDRERLFTKAFLAEFTAPVPALKEWSAFAALYPDNGAGQHNVGRISYMALNDLPAAEKALQGATVARNPLLNYTLHMRSLVLLGLERPAEAEQQMRAALKFSNAPLLYGQAMLLAVQGRFDEAMRYLEESRTSRPEDDEVERLLRLATLLVMQGDLSQALSRLHGALAIAGRAGAPNASWRTRAALLSIHWAQHDLASARDQSRRLLHDLSRIGATDDFPMVVEHLLYGAGWAARLGLVREAADALALSRRMTALEHFPVRQRLAEVAQAEIELHGGNPSAALDRTANVDGTALWEVHDVRARALRLRGDLPGERNELRWLAAHPGRALTQWLDQLLGQQARVLALNEARRELARRGAG